MARVRCDGRRETDEYGMREVHMFGRFVCIASSTYTSTPYFFFGSFSSFFFLRKKPHVRGAPMFVFEGLQKRGFKKRRFCFWRFFCNPKKKGS